MHTDSAAHRAYREGRFSVAARLLESRTELTQEEIVLAVELSYYLGDATNAVLKAETLLRSQRLPDVLAARCTRILAAELWDRGEIAKALDFSQQAAALAEQSADLVQRALCSAFLLERTCSCAPFDTALPLAMRARKHAVRAGDPHALAASHLTFGRLEGRAGNHDRAERHLGLSRELLTTTPNLHLDASVDLAECSLLWLSGRLDAALERAMHAAQTCEEIGWAKGMAAAAGNCAQVLAGMGRPTEALRQLQIMSSQRVGSTAHALAMANTRAYLALLSGDYEAAQEVLSKEQSRGRRSESWYLLAVQETYFRVLMSQRRWREALLCATAALHSARETGTVPFVEIFELAVAHAQLAAGVDPTQVALPNAGTYSGNISRFGAVSLLWGKALAQSGLNDRAQEHLWRAHRIFAAVGKTQDQAEAEAALEGVTDGKRHMQTLDSAVALLELGSHPQVLAEEALTALENSGAAKGAALIVGREPNARVVRSLCWTGPELHRLLRKETPSLERISCGEYRGESWEMLFEPRREIEHRCAILAIRKLVATALTLDRYRREEKQRAALWPAEALDGDPESVWASEQMSEILGIARRIAPTPLSILLTGETGTGKEMLARAIHRASDRAGRTFLPFNCTAVPRDMLESQLFGHRKGAFTGADAPFPGVIRAAAGGTLFLDEIADISLDLQPKLLRFLETREIHPLGEPQPIQVDVRIIAATNASLEQLVAEGRFREDLFYRLNVVRLRLPPLRERREEIPALTEHYLRRYGDEYGKRRLSLADETLEYLLLYAWPGNVRQLANEIRRIVAMAEPGATITPALLSPEIQASRRTIPAGGVAPEAEVRVRIDQPLPAAVETLEQLMVRHALDRARGRVEQAARLLGISRKGLFLKRRRWGIAATQPPEA